MAARDYAVSCVEHGPMERDPLAMAWRCTDSGCGRTISDGEVFEQVTGSPGDLSNPVTLVVT